MLMYSIALSIVVTDMIDVSLPFKAGSARPWTSPKATSRCGLKLSTAEVLPELPIAVNDSLARRSASDARSRPPRREGT